MSLEKPYNSGKEEVNKKLPHFDINPDRIKYESLTHDGFLKSDLIERQKYHEKNRKICEAISNGQKFSLTVSGMETGHLVSVYYKYGQMGDAFYALIDLPEGRMPLPILEDAIDNHLAKQPFVREITEVEGAYADGEGCTREDFEKWLRGIFGDQISAISFN
jgi:hypothetical protein